VDDSDTRARCQQAWPARRTAIDFRLPPPRDRPSEAISPAPDAELAVGGHLGQPLLADLRAAACAAMPLRSVPEEAAVGEVFGTLSVVVAVILHPVEADGRTPRRHHLRDLEVQPLAHLGAAMVQLHAAVGIDMHQRAGLVDAGGR
jgi:hypothetical protein